MDILKLCMTPIGIKQRRRTFTRIFTFPGSIQLSDSGPATFHQARLPFIYQRRDLTRATLGTAQHPPHMDALLNRLVD